MFRRNVAEFVCCCVCRLQQLSSERGPITAHIEGLEKHITTMYEELIDVFDVKKATDKVVEVKDKKIALLQNELRALGHISKQHETLIHSFRRDVGNIVNSNAGGKSVEESLRTLYKKYVRMEKVSEESLKATGGLHDVVHEFISHSAMDDFHHHGNSNPLTAMNGGGAGGGGGPRAGELLMQQIRAAGGHIGGAPMGGMGQQSMVHPSSASVHHPGSAGHSVPSTSHVNGHNTNGYGNGNGNGNNRNQVKEIEDALIESAKEAERQKGFVERASSNLQHRLDSTQTEMHRISKIRLAENSALLYECNNMRREIKASFVSRWFYFSKWFRKCTSLRLMFFLLSIRCICMCVHCIDIME